MATAITNEALPQLPPSPTDNTPDSPNLYPHYSPLNSRLSLPFPLRLPLCLALSTLTGLALGATHGSTTAGLRFRAENAHRFPSTQTGWYLYHKSKNYHMALGGVTEGVRMAGRLGVWVGVFVTMEEGLDRGRAGVVRWWEGLRGREVKEGLVEGGRDFVSTTLAGLGTAGAFSARSRFPVPTAVRTAKMGAKVGLLFGLAEDVVSLVKGRQLGYVEFVRRRVFGSGEEVDTGKALAGAG